MADYDHVFIMSSDIRTDRRMQRTIISLSCQYNRTLVLCRDLQLDDLEFQFPAEVKFIRLKWNSGPIFYAELVWKYIGVLRKLKFAAMTCVDTDTLLAGVYFKKLRKIITYFDSHENFSEVPELNGRSLKKWVWNKVEKLGVKHMDVLYTVSTSLGTDLSHRHGRPFKVIRNLPSTRKTNPVVINDELLRLIYIGMTNKGRGIEQVMECIAKSENISLDIVGNGDLYVSLIELSRNLEIEDKVKFHGWQPPENLQSLLSGKDIGLNLLDGQSASYRQSLANKFFDYIHAGIPVLTMDFEQYHRYNDEYQVGWLLKDLNRAELCQMLEHLKTNKASWYHMRNNCLKAREELNWLLESEKLISLYRPS